MGPRTGGSWRDSTEQLWDLGEEGARGRAWSSCGTQSGGGTGLRFFLNMYFSYFKFEFLKSKHYLFSSSKHRSSGCVGES